MIRPPAAYWRPSPLAIAIAIGFDLLLVALALGVFWLKGMISIHS